jgi:hypothetical protein
VGTDVDWAHPIASEQTKRRLANLQDFLMVTRRCNRLATPVRGLHCVMCVFCSKTRECGLPPSHLMMSVGRRAIGQTDTRRGHV